MTLAAPHAGASEALQRFSVGSVTTSDDGRRLWTPARNEPGLAVAALRALDDAGALVDDITVHRPSLDDVFAVLTGAARAGARERGGAGMSTAMPLTAEIGAPTLFGRLRSWWDNVRVMTRRNLIHVRRDPMQLSDVTIQPVLFTLLFCYVFGAAMVLPGGASYTQFALAGLLVMNLTTSAVGTAIGLSTDLSTGVISRLRTCRCRRPRSSWAGRSPTCSRRCSAASFIAVTGLVIGWRPETALPSVLAGFAIALLFSYALSWLSASVGMAFSNPEAAQGIVFIFVFPLAFVSNVFVPTQGMPAWLQTIANWNPVSAVASACRELFGNPNPSASIPAWPMQHPVEAAILWSLLILAVVRAAGRQAVPASHERLKAGERGRSLSRMGAGVGVGSPITAVQRSVVSPSSGGGKCRERDAPAGPSSSEARPLSLGASPRSGRRAPETGVRRCPLMTFPQRSPQRPAKCGATTSPLLGRQRDSRSAPPIRRIRMGSR